MLADVLIGLVLFLAMLTAIAGMQYVQLFLRRRWRRHVRLPDPSAFTDSSVRADQAIAIYVHSSKPVRITFSRCAKDGFAASLTVDAATSVQSRIMDVWKGFHWRPSATLPGNSLAPGFYRVDVEHQEDRGAIWHSCLLVKDVRPTPVVVIASTNTWNAYNAFGGLSNYRDGITPFPLRLMWLALRLLNTKIRVADRHWIPAVPLSERRPNAAIHQDFASESGTFSHLARAESALIRCLEQDGIAYSVASDRDFASSTALAHTRLLIFNTHSEYWSDEMIGRLAEACSRGISILFLSGNNMYRKVQLLADAIVVIDFRTSQSLVSPLLGASYDSCGYQTYEGYRAVDPHHWSLAGIGLGGDGEFGNATAERPGASGYETDKLRPESDGFRVVAIGKNPEGPAYMVVRDLPNGGFIFNVGSVGFAARLEDDPVIRALVRGLVRRALATQDERELRSVGRL